MNTQGYTEHSEEHIKLLHGYTENFHGYTENFHGYTAHFYGCMHWTFIFLDTQYIFSWIHSIIKDRIIHWAFPWLQWIFRWLQWAFPWIHIILMASSGQDHKALLYNSLPLPTHPPLPQGCNPPRVSGQKVKGCDRAPQETAGRGELRSLSGVTWGFLHWTSQEAPEADQRYRGQYGELQCSADLNRVKTDATMFEMSRTRFLS